MSIFDIFKRGNTSAKAGVTEVQTACNINSEPEEAIEPSNVEACKPATGPSPVQVGIARNVYNLIILDESGSMMSIYKPALTGMNETLQTIRMAQDEHPEQSHFVSLVAFDSNHYNQIYDCVEAAKAHDLTKEQYRPGGCTPLYDAMGRSINELRNRLKSGDVVLVTIITDGYENASREYNGKAIKNLIDSLKPQGWVFTYIGANQDVESVAGQMSIDNYMAFEADEESTEAIFA